jgi:hypothetical protein
VQGAKKMGLILGNLGRALALFVPTLFCLYGTHLYALNIFRFIAIYKLAASDRLTGIWYGFVLIAAGTVAYLIVLGLWWLLLSVAWRRHPDWISPKSWSNVFVNLAIATFSLFAAFLCEPSLWISGNIFSTDNQAYVAQVLESTFPKVVSIWLVMVNIIYLFKAKFEESGQTKLVTTNDIRKKYPSRKSQERLRQDRQSQTSTRQTQQLERQQTGESLEREKELLALIRDRKTCERLLKGLRRQYPNATRLWIIEKAIADIHRDRRAY